MSWSNPPNGVKSAPPLNLRRMTKEARAEVLDGLADDMTEVFTDGLIETVENAGGGAYDRQLVLALALRSMGRTLLGAMMAEALGATGNAKDGNRQVAHMRTILEKLADELATVEVEDVPVDDDLPEYVAAELKAKIASCGQKVLGTRIIRIGESYHVMLRVRQE